MRSLTTDVLVIGGGATGAGVLRDLALRGIRAVLVEKGDLTHGTTGRYHGLLHSGGRYVVKDPQSATECAEENEKQRQPAEQKRQGRPDIAMSHHFRHLLGSWLAESLADPRLTGRRFDFVVPVPLHSARKRERGFNQAELLALSLRRLTGLPVVNALQRTRYTTTQTQFDRNERMENLRGAFRLRRGSNVQDLRMLLVDDVLTTGSTLSECAKVLKKAGAISVHAATAARG